VSATSSSPSVETNLAAEASAAERVIANSFWLPVWTLALRELIRFFRQRTRVIGALGQPVLFWVLFGAGLRGSFKTPQWVPGEMSMSYQEYFFVGVAVLILMFTAIFSTISIIEDRREGFLQGVLVAPVSRLSLVLGKIIGGTVLAVLQAVLFLALGPALSLVGLAPTISMHLSVVSIIAGLGFLSLLAFTLTALGYVIAWPMDSTQGFHAIMSVVLMPMWLLSGSFFPGSPEGWMSWVIALNPLSYGVAGLRQIIYWNADFGGPGGLPSLSRCLLVTSLFGLACVILAVWLTRRQTSNDTR